MIDEMIFSVGSSFNNLSGIHSAEYQSVKLYDQMIPCLCDQFEEPVLETT